MRTEKTTWEVFTKKHEIPWKRPICVCIYIHIDMIIYIYICFSYLMGTMTSCQLLGWLGVLLFFLPQEGCDDHQKQFLSEKAREGWEPTTDSLGWTLGERWVVERLTLGKASVGDMGTVFHSMYTHIYIYTHVYNMMWIYEDMQEILEPLDIYIRRCRQRSLRSAGWTCQRTFAPGQARLLGMKQETCGGCFVHGWIGWTGQDFCKISEASKVHFSCEYLDIQDERLRWVYASLFQGSRYESFLALQKYMPSVAIARLGDHSDLRRPGDGDHLASAAVGALDPQRAWPKSMEGYTRCEWIHLQDQLDSMVILIHFDVHGHPHRMVAPNGCGDADRTVSNHKAGHPGWVILSEAQHFRNNYHLAIFRVCWNTFFILFPKKRGTLW